MVTRWGFSCLRLSLSFCLTLLILPFSGCKQEKITITAVPYIGEAPTYIAYDKGFFEAEGLDVTLKTNPGGNYSMRDLFEGKADIATVSELPIVYSLFDKQKYTDFDRADFCILGDMIFTQQDTMNIIGRRDHGINRPEDLTGKRIAVFQGTSQDYFLDLVLTDYKIKYSEIEIVPMSILDMNEALSKGEVDAITAWQPYAYKAQQELGDNSITINSRVRYGNSWVVIVMKEYALENPEILEKYTRAIVRAETFMNKNPEEAQEIYSRMSGESLETTIEIWDRIIFDFSLSEGLIRLMDGEARWMINKGQYSMEDLPDFMNYILTDPLEEVKPSGQFLQHDN